MSYTQFLDAKSGMIEALEKAMLEALSNMTIDELKQIDWFTYDKPIPMVVDDGE